jgi:hypothetical protein
MMTISKAGYWLKLSHDTKLRQFLRLENLRGTRATPQRNASEQLC